MLVVLGGHFLCQVYFTTILKVKLKKFLVSSVLWTKHWNQEFFFFFLIEVSLLSWRTAWQTTPVFLPGESPWTEETGRLQPMGSQRVRHD